MLFNRDKKSFSLSVLLFALSWAFLSACSQSNTNNQGGGNGSPGGLEIPFPHPEDFAEAASHGSFALDNNSVLKAAERCVPCHSIDSEESEEGAPGCKSCHTNYPHPEGFGDSSVHVEAAFDGNGNVYLAMLESCGTSCHGSDLAGGLSDIACNKCHESYPHGLVWSTETQHGSEFLVNPDAASLECASCHGADLRGGDYAPDCQECHQNFPHPPGFGDSNVHISSIYTGTGELMDVIEQNCASTCHGMDLQGGSVGVGCNDCHTLFPHTTIWSDASEHRTTVLAKSANALQDCKSCHGSDLGGGEFAPACQECHSVPTGSLAVQHDALMNETCGACHLANGDLVLNPPNLCQICHTQGTGSPTFAHSVVNSGDACANCHTPHESEFAALQKSDPSQLCYTCHNQEIVSVQYGTTENIQALLLGANSAHSSFVNGDCETCHDVHGSDFNHLVNAEPGTALCLQCHSETVYVDTQLYADAETDYNLLNLPTGFLKFRMAGSWLNLHYKHMTTEGLACVDCHNPHAAENTHLIVPEENYVEATGAFGYYFLAANCDGCHSGL